MYVGTTGDRDVEVEKEVFSDDEKISFVIDNDNEIFNEPMITVYYSKVDGEYEKLIYKFEIDIDPSHVWIHQPIKDASLSEGVADTTGVFNLRAYIGKDYFDEIQFTVE